MASSSLLSLALCLLVLFHTSLAQREHGEPQHRHIEQSDSRMESLDAPQPTHNLESQVGLNGFWNQNNEQLEYEFWDQNNEQLEYAGVATSYPAQRQDDCHLCRRQVYSSLGLYGSCYVQQPCGNGYIENVIPGSLAETFQSSQQREGEGGQRYRDQHHRIQRIEHGDIDDLRRSTRDQERMVAGVGRSADKYSGYAGTQPLVESDDVELACETGSKQGSRRYFKEDKDYGLNSQEFQPTIVSSQKGKKKKKNNKKSKKPKVKLIKNSINNGVEGTDRLLSGEEGVYVEVNLSAED